jgi:hypothetical protein
MFGVEPKLPGDPTPPHVFESPSEQLQAEYRNRLWQDMNNYRQEAAENTSRARVRAARNFNRDVVRSALEVGEWVLMKRKKKQKFMSGWIGPFEVVRRTDVGTYLIADPRGTILPAYIHRDLLKRVHLKPNEKPTRLWGQAGDIDLDIPGVFPLGERSDDVQENPVISENNMEGRGGTVA